MRWIFPLSTLIGLIFPAEQPSLWAQAQSAITSEEQEAEELDEDGVDPNATELREQKRYSANLELIGTHGAGALSHGLNLGIILAPNLLVELAQTWGQFEDKEKELRVALNLSGKTSLTEIRLKHYLVDTLYINAGLALRSLKGRLSAKSETSQVQEDSELLEIKDSRKIGLTFSFGSNWQWERLQIGCDWLGTFIPIVNVKENIDDQPIPDWLRTNFPDKADDASQASKDLLKVAKERTNYLLRFYVGMLF